MHCTDVAPGVVCLCVMGTRVSRAQTAEPITSPFGELTRVDPRNHVLYDRLKLFAAAKGDKTAMQPFAKLL